MKSKWKVWVKKEKSMSRQKYEYLEDKEFIRYMNITSDNIMKNLCHLLKEEFNISANFYKVGSGKENLITIIGNRPLDLDFNLEIVKCNYINDCELLRINTKKCLIKYYLICLIHSGVI